MGSTPDVLLLYLQVSWRFRRLYDRMFTELLRQYDLSPCERDILLFLYNHPEHDTASAIVRYRSISKSLVSRSVERLGAIGYLKTAPDPADRRQIRLAITEKALPIVQALHAAQDRCRQVFRECFSDTEYQELYRLLDQADHNINRYLKGEPNA